MGNVQQGSGVRGHVVSGRPDHLAGRLLLPPFYFSGPSPAGTLRLLFFILLNISPFILRCK